MVMVNKYKPHSRCLPVDYSVLQAFRHLYVLATEPRFVEAIDVDSRASVSVPLKVSALQPSQVTIKGCCLIWNSLVVDQTA